MSNWTRTLYTIDLTKSTCSKDPNSRKLGENHRTRNCGTAMNVLASHPLEYVSPVIQVLTRNLHTKPQMYPKSLRDTFRADLFSAVEASSTISSALIPTRAMPPSTPTVAGTPPWTRTTDSSSDARATLSGYGNPIFMSAQALILRNSPAG